ncbi:DUF305 domain-containing protein [Mucilaginibacter rubeus]|uniref:DUF305 domain-containing protein n=2 Tax=Mucilaginibacter rubeus TaxID=2027860 RepID=A0A364WWE8_9SPHI|nr:MULTISPECIES: DUF305 domain-containing protein [Mucilaginibacter]QEM06149.1 DUF305 domain-containing protein [Mucilaginibacter rubeus]QEM13666.1 DUF305 domain-containing protein [Mucilaginibacter rubeus]QEM18729.1 DUF305 domain-containing protein [Mucilaginibacter gossypii]QTE36276.1 DUF305 domain-containing protein [Mucilaginibacter gossypii]QTE44729.1 DUF305 domain-containing protein [Mucilaginibacter rubeus]
MMHKTPGLFALFLFYAVTVHGHGRNSYVSAGFVNPDTTVSFNSIIDKMNIQLGQLLMTGNTDRDIVMSIIVINLGAVELEMLEMQKGKNDRLVRNVRKMIAVRIHETLELNKFLVKGNLPENYDPLHKDGCIGRQIASFPQHKKLTFASRPTTDEEFVLLLIDLDQQGLKMIRVLSKYGNDKELRSFAKKIRKHLRAEMGELSGYYHRSGRPAINRLEHF